MSVKSPSIEIANLIREGYRGVDQWNQDSSRNTSILLMEFCLSCLPLFDSRTADFNNAREYHSNTTQVQINKERSTVVG